MYYHLIHSGDSIDILALLIANTYQNTQKIVAKIMDELVLEMGIVS